MDESFIAIISLLVYICFTLGIWVPIFGKAGYSWRRGLLMLIPVANLVIIITFLLGEWPVQREARELRMHGGSRTEEDAYSLIREAVDLEVKGGLDDALQKYQEVVTSFRDTAAGKDAEKSIEILRAKLEEIKEAKVCPKCSREYTDLEWKLCPYDGTPLEKESEE